MERFHFISMPVVWYLMNMFLEETIFWRKSINKGEIDCNYQPFSCLTTDILCVSFGTVSALSSFSSFSTNMSSFLILGILGKNPCRPSLLISICNLFFFEQVHIFLFNSIVQLLFVWFCWQFGNSLPYVSVHLCMFLEFFFKSYLLGYCTFQSLIFLQNTMC